MFDTENLGQFGSLRLIHTESRYRGGYDTFNGDIGFCVKTEITLLPEGLFHFKTIRKDLHNNGSYHSGKEQTQSGRWNWYYSDTDEALLILQFENSIERKLTINYKEQKGILMDGKRFEIEMDQADKANAGWA